MSRYWKAILAVTTAVGITVVQAVQAAYLDGTWTTEDSLVVALAFLGAVAVYGKANTPPAGQPSDPDVSETEA